MGEKNPQTTQTLSIKVVLFRHQGKRNRPEESILTDA